MGVVGRQEPLVLLPIVPGRVRKKHLYRARHAQDVPVQCPDCHRLISVPNYAAHRRRCKGYTGLLKCVYSLIEIKKKKFFVRFFLTVSLFFADRALLQLCAGDKARESLLLRIFAVVFSADAPWMLESRRVSSFWENLGYRQGTLRTEWHLTWNILNEDSLREKSSRTTTPS